MRSHSNTQVRDSQIIQHEAPLVITNPVNHLCVYDNRIESNQVRDKEANLLTLVKNIKWRLLPERNSSQSKLHDQRIFIRLLNYSVPERVQNLDCAADNLKNFVSGQQLFIIRVHSCSLVVNPGPESRAACKKTKGAH